MLRSMYSGISGMRGFQTKLDVVGNNIANVNTSGFKKGRVTFQDLMSQTTRGAQGPTGFRGGVNPMQVGLGSQVGSIDNTHTQGFRQSTDRPLDFAIEGNGMFAVKEGDSTYYTRAGNFYLDSDGTVVNPNGFLLQGSSPIKGDTFITHENDQKELKLKVENGGFVANGSTYDGQSISKINNGVIEVDDKIIAKIETTDGKHKLTYAEADGEFNEDEPSITVRPETEVTFSNTYGNLNIPLTAQSFSVDSDGILNYVDANGNPQVAGQIALANFTNPEGLNKIGDNLFLASANSGDADMGAPNLNGAGSVVSNALEMSNVDLAEEFTEMITAQRGFQANTRIITTSDEILQELVNLKR